MSASTTFKFPSFLRHGKDDHPSDSSSPSRERTVSSSSLKPRPRTLSKRFVSLSHSKAATVPRALGLAHHPYTVYHHHQTMRSIFLLLKAPETLAKLFQTILDSANGRRSLARLARSCRAIQSLALDVLWKDLPSLVPILGLFPAHVLKRAKKPGMGFSKHPEEHDWNVVQKYAPRVESLAYDERLGNVSPNVFPVIEARAAKTSSYLLPNLRKLAFKVDTPAGLDRCRLFLSPHLEEIALDLGYQCSQMGPILVDMSSRTKLKSFALTSHAALPPNFAELLLPQQELEKVVLSAPGAVTLATGQWLSSLKKLKHLELDLTRMGGRKADIFGFFGKDASAGRLTPMSVGSERDSGVFSGDEVDMMTEQKKRIRANQTNPPFQRLEYLILSGNASLLATFLENIASELVRLDLSIEEPPQEGSWERLATQISSGFADSLKSVRVGATQSSKFTDLIKSTSRVVPPTRRISFEPLHPSTTLTRFDLDLTESVSFAEEDVAHLARTCPNLEELRLCPLAKYPISGGPPKLTLSTVASLLVACCRLQTLAIVIDAKAESQLETLMARETSSSSLRNLHVGHSWIRDNLHVAIVLAHLAPNLQSLRWFHERNRPGYVEANARGWETVDEALPLLQKLVYTERRNTLLEKEDERESPGPTAPSLPPLEYIDMAVQCVVDTIEATTQATPLVSDVMVHAAPSLVSVATEARTEMTDQTVDATPAQTSKSVQVEVSAPEEATQFQSFKPVQVKASAPEEVTPAQTSKSVQVEASAPEEVTAAQTSKSVEVEVFAPEETADSITRQESSEDIEETKEEYPVYFMPSSLRSMPMPVPWMLGLMGTACRVFILYPLSVPPRVTRRLLQIPGSIISRISALGGVWHSREELEGKGEELSDEGQAQSNSNLTEAEWVRTVRPKIEWGQYGDDGWKRGLEFELARKQFEELIEDARLTRLSVKRQLTIIMSEKKQEKDYTAEVDAILPEAEKLVKQGQLQAGLDKLFALEKQTRNAADVKSTSKLVKTIAQHSYDAKDFATLNSSISVLSKKHGQLKGAIQALVEQAMEWLPQIKQEHGTEKWLELVETLRNVTEGKIFLETPRARVTSALSQYHEQLAASSSSSDPAKAKTSLETASELLSDLQVETYSSMERREKTEFILEQMRLLIAVARQKDADSEKDGRSGAGNGEAEWIKVRVGGRKVNEEFLKSKENEDIKLKYYDLMIQHALHDSAYLDATKYYYKIWETPSVKEDSKGKGLSTLEHIVCYIVLASHSNEQSDMLHHLYIDPELAKHSSHYELVKSFVKKELMRWPGVVELYGEFLRSTPVFKIDKRWDDLHTRVTEHNIRVISQYYGRITLQRLTSLLDLSEQETEKVLSRLVVSGSIWARIDRLSGIVTFTPKRTAEDVMNDWSSDMQKLLGLVEKTWMGMNAAQAAQSRALATSS